MWHTGLDGAATAEDVERIEKRWCASNWHYASQKLPSGILFAIPKRIGLTLQKGIHSREWDHAASDGNHQSATSQNLTVQRRQRPGLPNTASGRRQVTSLGAGRLSDTPSIEATSKDEVDVLRWFGGRLRTAPAGGRLVKHARYYWLMLAESHLTRRLFGSMIRRIGALAMATG